MSRLTIIMVIAASGCGRIAFDPIASGDAANGGIDTTSAGLCGRPDSTCPAGAAFCDDFETSSGTTFPRWANLDLHNWMTSGAANAATAGTTTPDACRGNVAFHARGAGAAQIVFLAQTIAPRPNPLYLRYLFRIASSSPSEDFEPLGLQNAGAFIDLGVDRTVPNIIVNEMSLAGSLNGTSGPAVIPTDQWMCFELRIQFATTATGALSVSLDGTTIFDVANQITDTAAGLKVLVLGASTGVGVTGTYDIEYDDLVVSPMPIGCN